jgi:short-subunit dehydrogenase
MQKRALVVGASSGIGAELVRRLVADGYLVAAVARREAELAALARKIDGDGPKRVFPFVADVRDVDRAKPLFDEIVRALDGLDLVIYAAGVMPRVGPDTYDIDADRQIVEVNVTGAMAWLNPAAERFGQLGAGTIVGIGSVAGDRGRIGQPAYCASKAALHTYLESLRNRLRRKGVSVVTIKPGPVRTPMTDGLDKLPMVIDVDVAAEGILRAVRRGAQEAYVPRQWSLVMWVIRMIPSAIFHRLNV